MSEDTYLSIEAPAEGIYKEKGSKFLAFAYPVRTEEDVKQRLAELHKTYFDARHHCYAYRLGAKGERFRANDDGEPNHSAGDPILGQIKSRNLSDTLVVVVRYFGGTKLGVSGLIHAYKVATAEALDVAQVIEKIVTQHLQVHFDYGQMNEVMRIIKELDLQILGQTFDNQCEILLEIRQKQYETAQTRFEKIDGVQLVQPAAEEDGE
ncbi:uncharacterized protein, YigZ family [Flexibacter flexilis DSM 6793]|uniref:Uncharacterized protein, YigZ family n=1 Tax=Flexibacter flexilis DSM 6793 TaxID=927664 RepID=A0A1I1D8U8_9BACT|nr:YigZ family protein [Flexibacter flexilis]SFB71355.1 uncharacterized protein, YigZ family [Flexibacter flexilis DSM 6793]